MMPSTRLINPCRHPSPRQVPCRSPSLQQGHIWEWWRCSFLSTQNIGVSNKEVANPLRSQTTDPIGPLFYLNKIKDDFFLILSIKTTFLINLPCKTHDFFIGKANKWNIWLIFTAYFRPERECRPFSYICLNGIRNKLKYNYKDQSSLLQMKKQSTKDKQGLNRRE